MKVIHVIEALGGGVYTYFKDLSHFMGQEGLKTNLETYIIYSDKRKEIIPENILKEFSGQVILIPLTMEREFRPFKDLKATLKLRKIFTDIKPDVIHLHSSKAGVIGRWANFLNFNHCKLFYTPHGYSFLRQDISKKKQCLFRFIEKYTQYFFGGITIACGDTEFEVAKKLGNSRLVRNGIDFKKVSKFHENNASKKLTFGIVGRITAQKNPELFNEIALMFPQYNFIWIGDGELKHAISAENIKITGWLFSPEEVYHCINQTDVFLQTSLWEGLPIAVLEAMALRKPVVATNVIGNKDIVIPNENGFLFDKTIELSDYFKQLESLAFRNKMSEKAYISAKENFDMNENFKSLLEIYYS